MRRHFHSQRCDPRAKSPKAARHCGRAFGKANEFPLIVDAFQRRAKRGEDRRRNQQPSAGLGEPEWRIAHGDGQEQTQSDTEERPFEQPAGRAAQALVKIAGAPLGLDMNTKLAACVIAHHMFEKFGAARSARAEQAALIRFIRIDANWRHIMMECLMQRIDGAARTIADYVCRDMARLPRIKARRSKIRCKIQ